jgi:mannan endo-1,4-beta-mannosidase
MIKKHQKYLLLNFANELGAWGTTPSQYITEYSRAIVALRTAGIHVPIVIDGSKCGQDEAIIMEAGPALIKADPDHNIVMSLHIYWTDQSAARITKAITDSVAKNIPMIIGEFASVAVDCSTPILYKEIMKQAQINEIGYLPWSWDNQNACATHAMTKDANQSFSTLWGWALEVAVTDPNSIKNTSVRSQCFQKSLRKNSKTKPTRRY